MSLHTCIFVALYKKFLEGVSIFSVVKDGGGDGGNANNGGSSEGAGGPWEDYFNGGGFHLRRHRL